LRRDAFSDRDVAGRRDECGELLVGHRRFVHPERIDGDEMNGFSVRHPAVRASHVKRAARDPDHAKRRHGGGATTARATDRRGRRENDGGESVAPKPSIQLHLSRPGGLCLGARFSLNGGLS